MNKLILLIVFTILLVSYAEAGTQKTLYSDRVDDKSSVSVSGENLSIVTSYSGVSANYGRHNFLARTGKCDSDGSFTFCVSEIVPEFYAIVTLYVDVSDMQLTKTRVDKFEDIGVSDVITFNVKVNNEGTANGGFFLEDDFSGFNVLDTNKNCYVLDNKIRMNYTLKTGSSIDCTYRIKAVEEGSYKLKAELKYFDGFENKEATADPSVNVRKNNLELNAEIDKIIYNFLDKGEVTIKIKNNFKEKITINKLEINFPKLYLIDADSKFKRGDKSLIIENQEIDKDEEKEFKFSLNITSLNNEFPIKLQYTGAGRVDSVLKKVKFDISNPGPTALLERLDNKVKIHIQNSASLLLININIKMRSNYKNLNVPKNIPFLFPNEERILEFDLDEIPDYNVKYPIFVHGDYETDYGEKLSFSRTLQLNFATKQQILESGVDTLTNSSSNIATFVGDTGYKIPKSLKIAGIVIGSLVIAVLFIYLIIFGKKRYNMKRQFSDKMKDVKL